MYAADSIMKILFKQFVQCFLLKDLNAKHIKLIKRRPKLLSFTIKLILKYSLTN